MAKNQAIGNEKVIFEIFAALTFKSNASPCFPSLQIIGANKIHGQILIKKIDAGEEIFPPLKVNSNNYDEQMNQEKEDFEITSWNDSHEGML